MDTLKRREVVEKILKENSHPIKGAKLADDLNVSRQVIVQDIAILRAKGINIIATPQGYIIPNMIKEDLIKVIMSKHHSDINEIKEELEIIVDMGAKVVDVIVEHPVYGELRGVINISSRRELNEFIQKIEKEDSKLMSSLTNGIHYHTIQVKNEDVYQSIIEELDKKGYLMTNK
ncbi:MAG: transcription repressor NadR [Tepidibacter sp.]|jgi:transcriptional regulator of NAD metabolism|uniref:transcription repressor NadR n=1 Tax=Tepidibacter sp. TaxID=2529387 RepID=UPI0025CD9C6A|nr:transcription repressor NadR [Tepidibacter sp.]MCT4508565.1 transcription repressor NadR [Tepidibacter sp.]